MDWIFQRIEKTKRKHNRPHSTYIVASYFYLANLRFMYSLTAYDLCIPKFECPSPRIIVSMRTNIVPNSQCKCRGGGLLSHCTMYNCTRLYTIHRPRAPYNMSMNFMWSAYIFVEIRLGEWAAHAASFESHLDFDPFLVATITIQFYSSIVFIFSCYTAPCTATAAEFIFISQQKK